MSHLPYGDDGQAAPDVKVEYGYCDSLPAYAFLPLTPHSGDSAGGFGKPAVILGYTTVKQLAKATGSLRSEDTAVGVDGDSGSIGRTAIPYEF